MFIQTEDTPNPASLKFLPGEPVLGAGASPMDFPTFESAESSPLARALFAVDGVVSVLLGADFVTVSKDQTVDWVHIKPSVLGVIADHYAAGLPALEAGAGAPKAGANLDDYEGETREIVEQIVELLDTRVRPAVAQDGGDITFSRYEEGEGVVFLHMQGACAGCPASTYTLKQGVENMLKHYVPEVTRVEAVA